MDLERKKPYHQPTPTILSPEMEFVPNCGRPLQNERKRERAEEIFRDEAIPCFNTLKHSRHHKNSELYGYFFDLIDALSALNTLGCQIRFPASVTIRSFKGQTKIETEERDDREIEYSLWIPEPATSRSFNELEFTF